MGVASQDESRLDPRAVADQLDLLDAAAAVLTGELLGRDACALQNARVDDELSRRGGPDRVAIRDRLRRRLNRGLTRTLSPGAHEDALLSSAKTDHGRGRDGEREHDGQGGLAPCVAYGVHSTRRAAAPSTVKRGRPTNPSGMGIA